jgi:hypothetical protein
MTQTPSPRRAGAKRREQELLAEYRHRQQQLQELPPGDLDALVAGTVFGRSDLAGVPFSTSWDALGRLVGRMRERGFTRHLASFEPSHVEWMNNLPSHIHRGVNYRPAEVTVVDIHRRLSLPSGLLHLQVSADTLPRAAAIAAVLSYQMEADVSAVPILPPVAVPTKVGWSEERRRHHSERMKHYWQQRRAAEYVEKGADRP